MDVQCKRKTIYSAVKFVSSERPWPQCVTPWSEKGYQPRDMSWGCCRTAMNAETHVFDGDWIVTDELGMLHCFSDEEFQSRFEVI